MAEAKTRPTGQAVEDFLNSIDHEKRKKDGFEVLEMMTRITGQPATMWGPSIVGFGTYTMTYANGKQADWMRVGFSPRKAKMVLYIMAGFDHVNEQIEGLGKYKTGKGCLYINKLEDIDKDKLESVIAKCYSKFDE